MEEHWIRNSRFINARYEVIMAVNMRIIIFDVMLRSLVFTDVSDKRTAPPSA